MKKILITGGHLAPALTIIDDILLSAYRKDTKIIFVGRKYSSGSQDNYSFEYKEISSRKIEFAYLPAGRVTRLFNLKSFINLLKIPTGFLYAWQILDRYQPDLILSFGGYLGLPIVMAGFFQKIPVYIHEQTLSPGLANRLSGQFAKKVFLSFPQTEAFFDKKKTLITGNPIREEIFKTINPPFKIIKNLPVVYVTGGTLGSHSINEHIKKILPDLLKDYIIIHQTGNVKEYNDFLELQALKKGLMSDLQSHYYLQEHFSSQEIGYIYKLADLVVGRAGANTFFELIALKKPAILIPLPWSANHEQQKQAEILAEGKTAEIFSQFNSSQNLLKLIKKMVTNLEFYQNNFQKLKSFYRQDASQKIIGEIFSES